MGKVIAVEAQKGKDRIVFSAEQRVVIATGGFSANKKMREEYNEKLKELDINILTSGPQGLTGDGIAMGMEVGAAVVNMNSIQLYPNTNPTTGILFFMDSRRIEMGAFYLNMEGRRFVNENQTRGVVASAVLAQPESTMYEVFTQDILDEILVSELARREFNQWTHQGVLAKGETIGECAEFFSLDKKEITKTLNRYNTQIKNKRDEDFGREMDYPVLNEGPYYMLEGVPAIHYTLGGLKIDSKARVLDGSGSPIPRLYAAGEVTGGVFGNERLGACALTDALVFGRIAGGFDPE
jgi:flavocytochrome c